MDVTHTTQAPASLDLPIYCSTHVDSFLPVWCKSCQRMMANQKLLGIYQPLRDGDGWRNHGEPRQHL